MCTYNWERRFFRLCLAESTSLELSSRIASVTWPLVCQRQLQIEEASRKDLGF